MMWCHGNSFLPASFFNATSVKDFVESKNKKICTGNRFTRKAAGGQKADSRSSWKEFKWLTCNMLTMIAWGLLRMGKIVTEGKEAKDGLLGSQVWSPFAAVETTKTDT